MKSGDRVRGLEMLTSDRQDAGEKAQWIEGELVLVENPYGDVNHFIAVEGERVPRAVETDSVQLVEGSD